MAKKYLDSIDRRLIRLLSEDGLMRTKEIAKQLKITIPTVNSRRKKLIESGFFKIAGLIDAFKADDIIIALVAIKVEKDERVDEIVEKLSKLSQVSWIAIVAGRYDILAEVLLTKGMISLYQFTVEDLPKIRGIQTSESFVVMKSKNKWVLLPQKMKGWYE